jgi:hypothetical protein
LKIVDNFDIGFFFLTGIYMSRARKIALLRTHMSNTVIDKLSVDVLPNSAIDQIIAATGLSGLDSSYRMAELYIEAHAMRIRIAAEKDGLDAAISAWNSTFPGESGLDAKLCELIDGEQSVGKREKVIALYHSYQDGMRAELTPIPELEGLDEGDEWCGDNSRSWDSD